MAGQQDLRGKRGYNSNESNEKLTLSQMSDGAIRENWPMLFGRRKYPTNDSSIKSNVPNRTLYDRIKNNNYHFKSPCEGRYTANDLDKAVQESFAGKPVSQLSIKYNIPKPTIYLHKRKNILARNNMGISAQSTNQYNTSISESNQIFGDHVLKTSPRVLGYGNYSAIDLDKAVQANLAGMSNTEASRRYNVPRSTIFDNKKRLKEDIARRT